MIYNMDSNYKTSSVGDVMNVDFRLFLRLCDLCGLLSLASSCTHGAVDLPTLQVP